MRGGYIAGGYQCVFIAFTVFVSSTASNLVIVLRMVVASDMAFRLSHDSLWLRSVASVDDVDQLYARRRYMDKFT